MNQELERLLDLALVGGNFTEKKKQVLLRKAEELGVDQDEFEMILDAKLFLAQNSQSTSAQEHRDGVRRTQKEGDMRKCPSCGAPVQSFSTHCSECGHEFRNIESSNSVRELEKKLADAEEKVRNDKSNGGLFGGIMKLVDGETDLEKRIYNAKANILTSFPIPNSKEDILEFLALSVSNVNSIKIGGMVKMAGTSGTYGYKISYKNSWLSMANKVIMKARFSLKEDTRTLEEVEHYAKQLKIK